jgi:O-antigen ligase
MEIFVWVILAAGLFQAIYGLTQLWGGTGRIFAWKNKYNQGSAFGTYVNRDHYSGFLEMVFPLSIGYLLAKARFFSMKPGLSLKEKILWYSQERLQKTLILAMLSVLLGLGIIFSRCRAGVLIFLVSLFLMSLIVSASGSRGRHKSSHHDSGPSPKLIRTIFIGVAAAAVLIGLNPVISRFTKENVAFDKGRAVYYQNSLELASRFPLSGSGAGTFVHAYPLVEKEDASGLLTHAHNDYLEILVEVGFPAGGALILAGLGMLGFLFGRWLKRRDHFVRGIALGAMTGIVALFIHGFLDFNLRIPANAVYFIVLFALALRAVRLPSQG